MSDTTAVIVPVRVTALAVNPAVRSTAFHRWQPDFTKAPHLDPEPRPPAGEVQPLDDRDDGIHLQWELPAALREGRHDPVTGRTVLPAVPNRWLVIRYSGPRAHRAATGWIVQSDRLRRLSEVPADQRRNVSPHPGRTAADAAAAMALGGHYPLAGGLRETGIDSVPLTAAGPGLLTFAAFQPYNRGVFSLHDPLTDLPTEEQDRADLGYTVMGWYADPAADPLADRRRFPTPEQALERMRWQVGAPESGPRRSVYSGSVLGVAWDRGAQTSDLRKTDEAPERGGLTVGVGESSVEGLTAILDRDNPADTEERRRLYRLLEAFQYDLLHELDRPDGPAKARRLAHRVRFEPVDGGYEWRLVAADAAGTPAEELRDLPPQEREWLTGLDTAQEGYDAAARDLAKLQARLHELWWARQEADRQRAVLEASKPHLKSRLKGHQAKIERIARRIRDLDARLGAAGPGPSGPPDPEAPLRARVEAQRLATERAAAKVPAETADTTLDEAIDAETDRFRQRHGRMPVGRLQRVPRQPFHRGAEPVVLIRGAKAQRLLTEPGPLPCRAPGEILTALGDTRAPEPAPAPAGFDTLLAHLGLGDVPTRLLAEFALLDTAPDSMKAALAEQARRLREPAGASGAEHRPDGQGRAASARDIQTALWKQPWTPLFLLWSARFHPLPFSAAGGGPNWTRTDQGYEWTGARPAPVPEPIHLEGRILLTPHAVFTIAERVDRLTRTPDPSLSEHGKRAREALTALAGRLREGAAGDLLSQALDGFSDQLMARTAGTRRRPPADIAAESGGHWTHVPHVSDFAADTPLAAPFQQLRAGQFHFTDLIVVDRYGRSVEIIGKADQAYPTALARAHTVTPTDGRTVDPTDPPRFVQLAPRLPQPVRVDFGLVHPEDDGVRITAATPGSPVCGWVLPNFLDEGLLCYTADGSLAGELRVEARRLRWEAAPASPWPTAESLRAAVGHLPRFLTGLLDGGAAAFDDLQRTIDQGLVTVDPTVHHPGHPTLRLIGRPLALLRARITLTADGLPLVPPPVGEQAGPDDAPAYLGYTWPVRLGEDRSLGDGLIGHFREGDYGSFHAVHRASGLGSRYVAADTARDGLLVSCGGAPAHVTLLADPWARVHADVEILPVAELGLAPSTVAAAMARMEMVFRTGPVLGTDRLLRTETQKSDGAVRPVSAFPVPLPAAAHGEWNWWQRIGPDTQELKVVSCDTLARSDPRPPVLRSGRLHLTGTFAKTTETAEKGKKA